MSKFLTKIATEAIADRSGRYERFGLRENPFPSDPFVNRESQDSRLNGRIFELNVRREEYERLTNLFLKPPKGQPESPRLGFIVDNSYVGRGNGKTAFLVNVINLINADYNCSLSGGANRCFAVYISPQPGGRTKTFSSCLDQIFNSMIRQSIIRDTLVTIYSMAASAVSPKCLDGMSDDEISSKLLQMEWYESLGISLSAVYDTIFSMAGARSLPVDFPLNTARRSLLPEIVSPQDISAYYAEFAKKGASQLDFMFTDLINFFKMAGFNGGFLFIDDFERIPDFQSYRQKRDFALEVRSCFFDGLYENAKQGFYTLSLVLHAGVQRLIQEAWQETGMEARAPMLMTPTTNHIIKFEKLTTARARDLIARYVDEFATNPKKTATWPFSEPALDRLAVLSELNASRLLKLCYGVLDRASEDRSVAEIDVQFLDKLKTEGLLTDGQSVPLESIGDLDTVNLAVKAKEE
ncbi:hypothetical protein BH09SUM1_BH09SUM1_22220 [soil metagenome]